MTVSFSEIRDTEVVNLCDGKRVGYVCDADIDPECGRITRLAIPAKSGLFPGKSRIYIRWENIERIGEDIILVRYTEIQQNKH